MRAPAKKAILNVIIVSAIGAILLICVFILAQIREHNIAIQQQQVIIREQTDITQRFIRCLVLIPGSSIRTPRERARAIDACARESRLPKDRTNPTGEAHGRNSTNGKPSERLAVAPPKAQPPNKKGATKRPSPQNPPTEPEEPPETEGLVTPKIEIGPIHIEPIRIPAW